MFIWYPNGYIFSCLFPLCANESWLLFRHRDDLLHHTLMSSLSEWELTPKCSEHKPMKQIGNQHNLIDNCKYSSYGYSPTSNHFDHPKINSWVANFGAAAQLT